MTLGALIALAIEFLRLINRSGGVKEALATVKTVNDTFDRLRVGKTPQDKQDAAELVSKLLSGS